MPFTINKSNLKLLYSIFLRGSTGYLELPNNKLWLEKGNPAAFEPPDRGESIKKLLMESGYDRKPEIEKILKESSQINDDLGDVLLNADLLTDDELGELKKERFLRQFSRFCLKDEQAKFVEVEEIPEDIPSNSLNLFEAVFFLFLNYTTAEQLSLMQKDLENWLLSPSTNLQYLLPGMKLDEKILNSINNWQTSRSFVDLMMVSGLSQRETIAVVSMLQLVEGLTLTPKIKKGEVVNKEDVGRQVKLTGSEKSFESAIDLHADDLSEMQEDPAAAILNMASSSGETVSVSKKTQEKVLSNVAARKARVAPAPPEPKKEMTPELRKIEVEIDTRLAALSSNNPAKILGLEVDASEKQAKLVYADLARRLHPDRLTGTALENRVEDCSKVFASIGNAYRMLTDKKERAAFLLAVKDPVLKGDMNKAEQRERARLETEKTKIVFNKRDFKEVVKNGTRSLMIFPHDPMVLSMVAWAKLNMAEDKVKGCQEASELLERALANDPRSDIAHYYKGVVSKIIGNNAEARKQFELVLKFNPNHEKAKRELMHLK